ncbi:MAG: N-6 DNA methylase [Ruminococcus sp.]|nr:N-6 DNA methylase [Ruminococcus sp.]
MNHAQLKKFAVRSREKLLAVTDERTTYTSFMRLCAAAFVRPQYMIQLRDMSAEERQSAFAEKCRELDGHYGGVFNTGGGDVEYPEVLLGDILADLPLSEMDRDDILGWMHQYFNEPYRSSLAVGLKKSKRLDSDDIAPATQVFTPDWIAEYLVENTLVRKWYECGGAKLNGCDSYILGEVQRSGHISPEDISFLDPCAGSGNMLLCAFDVFMEMYRACGYSDNIAADMILRKNLFGLEMDQRVCGAAVTALRKKAADHGSDAQPQVFNFSGGDVENPAGSLSNADECTGGAKAVLSGKYDVVATNPPYLGHSAMDSRLLGYIKKKYPEHYSDLFITFVVRSCELVKADGKLGFLTPYTWLFINSCEPFRRLILGEKCPETLVQLEYSAFDEAVVPLCMFTFANSPSASECTFLRLTEHEGEMDVQRRMILEGASADSCGYRFRMKAADMLKIPSAPVAYWLSESAVKCFDMPALGDRYDVREGLITGDNDRFLRRWFEVCADKTAFRRTTGKKWYLLNKGGDMRRWYGNREYVIDWENDGRRIRDFRDDNGSLRSRPQNLEYCFRRSVSWSALTSSSITVRYYDENFMFNVAGSCAFADDDGQLMWLLALLNSKVIAVLSQAVNPTMNMNPGDTARLPVPEYSGETRIGELAQECVKLCRQDWDSFETSFDFKRHPLI